MHSISVFCINKDKSDEVNRRKSLIEIKLMALTKNLLEPVRSLLVKQMISLLMISLLHLLALLLMQLLSCLIL